MKKWMCRVALSLGVLIAFQSIAAAVEERVLGDFEGSVEPLFTPNTASTRFTVVREHATRGEYSLKVVCSGRYPGLQISRPQNWSGFTLLKFSVFNPGRKNLVGKMRIGVYVCHCGGNISEVVDVKEVVSFAEKLPDVVVVRDNEHMCSEIGQQMVMNDISEHKLDGVVILSLIHI